MKNQLYITTNHPTPEALTGVAGVHRKIEQFQRENRERADRIASNGSQESQNSELLSVAEVAKLLKISDKTVRRWTEREHDRLPAIKIFRNQQYTWSFNRADVLEWFNLHRQS